MNHSTGSDFKFSALTLAEKFLISGNALCVIGFSIMSLGRLLKLLNNGELPEEPIIESNKLNSSHQQDHAKRKSSFFSP